MKPYILISVVFFFTSNILLGQSTDNLKHYKPKRIISTVEFFGGLALNIPNDKGWDDLTYNGSNGRASYESTARSGHTFGITLIHSITERFELQGRASVEHRKYFESLIGYDYNGAIYSESNGVQKNKYLNCSIAPTYFLSKRHGLHLFSGITYLYLTKSLAIGELYINGQYVGGSHLNTIDGFERIVIDAIAGVGYLFSLSNTFSGAIRIQGNYGLSNSMAENQKNMSINSLSLSLAIRYKRSSLNNQLTINKL